MTPEKFEIIKVMGSLVTPILWLEGDKPPCHGTFLVLTRFTDPVDKEVYYLVTADYYTERYGWDEPADGEYTQIIGYAYFPSPLARKEND